MTRKFLIIFCLIALSGTAWATDTAKEQRWAEQITDMLVVGEAEWLEANGQKFLALYTEDTTGAPKGAVILVHGTGAHPDWPDVIHPLRVRLPDHGWSTLSIQAPVLANEAGYAEYAPLIKEAAPRIQAAVAFLQQRAPDLPVFLLGHSLGATMATACVADTPDLPLAGLAIVGLSVRDEDPLLDSLAYLQRLRLPVFDLYGSRDLPAVTASAPARRKAAVRAGNRAYRQFEVSGADHFFQGLEDELVSRVRGWLETTTKQREDTP
ncbi:alpha/beta fold hydrolase [Thiohalobacter sp.]|uniref:alpha/beta fold hydrolase n=1 Tax=Thiohalobacter sp. TaxID=2025948 RepID=UPI00262DE74F|nr:alpha/beta fold hydrolase [Thiohalobacter sp.]